MNTKKVAGYTGLIINLALIAMLNAAIVLVGDSINREAKYEHYLVEKKVQNATVIIPSEITEKWDQITYLMDTEGLPINTREMTEEEKQTLAVAREKLAIKQRQILAIMVAFLLLGVTVGVWLGVRYRYAVPNLAGGVWNVLRMVHERV